MRRKLDLLFYFLCFAFLYIHLFALPATPFYYEADHVNLLNDAKRMTEGEIIYRDFFEFLFPGAPSLFAALMTLWGPKYWLVSAVTILHGIIAAFLGLQISRKLIGDRAAAYLPAAIFIFLGFRWFGIDGEHRMISPLFSYLAILLLIPSRSLGRLAAAAAACAMASFFTQQRGFLTAAAVSICLLIEFGLMKREWTRSFKSVLVFNTVFVAILGVILLPFILVAGWERFVEYTFLFLLDYAQDPTTNSLQTYLHTFSKVLSFGNIVTIVTLFYSVLIPLVYIAALFYLSARRLQVGADKLMGIVLTAMVGLFLAVGTSGPNINRLYQVSLPALICFVWLIYQIFTPPKALARAAAALLVFSGLLLGVRLQTAWDTKKIATPSGGLVFLSPVILERYEWLLENSLPDDLVYEVYNSHVNFPLGLRNPSRMSILLNSAYSPPHHVGWAIEDLKRAEPRYIIWDGTWTREMEQLSDEERLKPFYKYLTENYQLRKSFTPYDDRERQVWERIRQEDLIDGDS